MLLVGDQDQRNPLPDSFLIEIKNNPKVHRISYKENLPPFIAAMDIFVMPSYREGFGNSIIEASAMGQPVIATNIPGCKDAVKDGETGILVNSKDVTSLQKAIEQLVTNPDKRKIMGQNGLKWVKENFDRDMVWSMTIAVYEQLLQKRK